MSGKKLTYDYDIIKKSGQLIDINRIKSDRDLLFKELAEKGNELFVAPSVGARVTKLKTENELKQYLEKQTFKAKEIQFFSIARKGETIDSSQHQSLGTKPDISPVSGNSIYQSVLKQIKNSGASIKDNDN